MIASDRPIAGSVPKYFLAIACVITAVSGSASALVGSPLIDGKLDTSIRHNNYNVGDAHMFFRDNRMALDADWTISDALHFRNTAYYFKSHRSWRDLEAYFARIAPESSAYEHDDEGPDDMPAHLRAALTQTQLSLPLIDGALALGTWQGIYLFEHRRRPHRRTLALHLIGA